MSNDNTQLVQDLYAALARQDVPFITAHLASDFTAAQSTELPWGGSFAGLAGLMQMLTTLRQHIVPTVEVDQLIDAGEHVVAIGRTRGTTAQGARAFDVPLAHLWHLREGKVVSFRPYIDHPPMLAALRDRGSANAPSATPSA